MIVSGEVVGRWVCAKAGSKWSEHCRAIGWLSKGELVVGVMYDGYTGASIAMHSRCDDPSRVSRKFYQAIFDYPFNQLQVKRVTALVSSANTHAQRIDEKLGFVQEAVLADYFDDGDGIVYIMRRENCRWLPKDCSHD